MKEKEKELFIYRFVKVISKESKLGYMNAVMLKIVHISCYYKSIGRRLLALLKGGCES
jgi:hypothetical protein